MSKKVQSVLIAAGFSAVFFLLIWFILIHVYCAMEENVSLTFFQAIGAGFERMSKSPLRIFPLPVKSFLTTLVIFVLFGIIIMMVFMDQQQKQHVKRKTALGDAHFLQGKELEEYNKKYTEPIGKPSSSGFNNIILAQDLFQSMDNEATNRNCNVLVIAGSGRGKSFRYCGPNLLQANASFVTTDPSGTLYRQYGNFFEHKGYKVKCFNLDRMNMSCHYNPFEYIHSDKDIMVLVDTLIANTTPPQAHSGDPFWEKAEAALFNAIIAYQWHYMDKKFWNFSTTLNMIRMGNISEDGKPLEISADDSDGEKTLTLQDMFDEAKKDDPNGFAIKQFGNFILGAGKTIKSILVSCAFRIKAFDLEDVKMLTIRDDIDLDSIGDEKTALFIIIPTGQKTFNYIAALMYSQLFIRLYDYCENSAINTLIVRDKKGEVIKTFRCDELPSDAKKREEILERNNDIAQAFLRDIRKATISYNKTLEWYEIRTPKTDDGKGEILVGFRKTKSEAEEALAAMKEAEVVKNRGEQLPIHVRFMMDEAANTGQVPELDMRVSTCRKYNISIDIILQSLKQLQKLYEKEWDTITSNCDNICYMGGGADKETTTWVAELCGKETRLVANNSFSSRSGQMGISPHAVELMAAYQLRTLKTKEMIVLPVGLPPFKGAMYDTLNHPNWHLTKGPKYQFNYRKVLKLISEEQRSPYKTLTEESDERHGGQKDNTKEKQQATDEQNEALNEALEQKDQEIKDGISTEGEAVVTDPSVVNAALDTMANDLGINSQKDLTKATDSLVELNRSLGSVYTVYTDEPMDSRRQKAS